MPKYLPKIIVPLLLLFFFTQLASAAITELVWQTEGTIFSNPTINNVEVMQLEDGQYRMYYHQGPSTLKSAISTDGRTFTPESGTRLSGSMPAIIKLPSGLWRMYFKSGTGIFRSATSNDGLTWTVEAGNRLVSGGQYDPDDIAHPTIVALPQGGYRLYYDGEIRRTQQEFTWQVLSATSTDGLSFVKDEGVRLAVATEPLSTGLSFSPHVAFENGQYLLYFSAEREGGPDGIYLATSENGLTFTVQEEPLLAWEAQSTAGQVPNYPQDPFVLEFSTGKRMYYWTSDGGILSATQVQQEVQEQLPWYKEIGQNFLKWIKSIQNIELGNLELYIVPSVLLTTAAVVAYLFLKFSRK